MKLPDPSAARRFMWFGWLFSYFLARLAPSRHAMQMTPWAKGLTRFIYSVVCGTF